MKLAASNIAWSSPLDEQAFSILRQNGFSGVEVAPSRVWPRWEGATVESARNYASWLRDEGFEVPAFQAILFGQTGVGLFKGDAQREKFRSHVLMVATLAAEMGAKVMVLGAPASRDRGAMSEEDASEDVEEFLRKVGNECADIGAVLCLEPNPKEYGCNWMTTAAQSADFVKTVASPGFGLHLDAAAMVMAGENPASTINNLAMQFSHFHVSEPQLAPVPSNQVPHREIGKALRESQYDGWVSLEMRETSDPLYSLMVACAAVNEFYGSFQE